MKKLFKLALFATAALTISASNAQASELTSISQVPGGYYSHAVFGPMEYVPEVDMNAPLSPNKQVRDAQYFLRTIEREIRKLLWEIEDLASNTENASTGMVTASNLKLTHLENFARANGMHISIHKRDTGNNGNATEDTGVALNKSYYVTIKFADNAPAALLNNATFRFIFKWGISHTSGNNVLVPNGLGCMTDWEETESSGIWHAPLASTSNNELKHGQAMHGGVSPRARNVGGIWANCLALPSDLLIRADTNDYSVDGTSTSIQGGQIGIHLDNLSWGTAVSQT